MRLVILGAPGSGKKTQTGLLARKYGLTTLTTSELVKRAIAEESERGMQLRQLQLAGQPVTEDVILNLLQERLLQPDVSDGFMLDGFPRNLLQALTLDELLDEMGLPLDFVLLIHIETDTLMERLVGRRTCRSCGAIYNIYTNPAVVEDVCDLCGGRLHQRAEYNEETVSSRLHVFDHLTSPLLSHYGKLGKLLRVDGDGEVEDVFVRACETIETFLRQQGKQEAESDPPRESPKEAVQAKKGRSGAAAAPKPLPISAAGQGKRQAKGRAAGGSADQTTTSAVKQKQAKKKVAVVKQTSKKASTGKPATKAAAKQVPVKKTVSRPASKKEKTKILVAKKRVTASQGKKKASPGKRAEPGNKAVSRVTDRKTGTGKAVGKQQGATQKPSPKKKAVKKKTVQKKAAQRASAVQPMTAKKRVSAKKQAAPAQVKKKVAPAARKKAAAKKPPATTARKKVIRKAAVQKKAGKHKATMKAPAKKAAARKRA